MRKFPRLLVVLLCCLPVFGQNFRWDSQSTTTTGTGQQLPVLALPGVVIHFYTGCSVLPCVSPATTYNGAASTTACPSGQQVIWQLPEPQACTSVADGQGNFGGYFQPGAYQYTVNIGPTTYGPYQFNVGGSGGGSSGVSSIIAGTNVTCTPNSAGSCTGNVTVNAGGGGGGGGVNIGTPPQIPYYNTAVTVAGDPYFMDSAPFATAGTGLLTYTGPAGINFITNYGGNFNLNTSNANAVTTDDSQITLTSSTTLVQSGVPSPGLISLTTTDSSGMLGAANIDLVAQESGSGSNANQANINISALGGGAGTNNGNVTITANANDGTAASGNITLNTSIGGPSAQGADINLTTNGSPGSPPSTSSAAINLSATGGFSPITLLASNVDLDYLGNLTTLGSVTVSGGTPGITNNGASWTAGAGTPTSSCAVGSLYSNTSASSAGTVLYRCYPANTWSAVP